MTKNYNQIRDWGQLIVGTVIAGTAVYFFMIPSQVMVGSISGLAIILGEFLPLSVSSITMLLNVLLLIAGFFLVGMDFGRKTVVTSLLLPLVLGFYEKFFPNNPSIMGDPFLDMLCYIFLSNIGLAMLFTCNASSGGLDIIAKMLNKFLRLDLGKAMTLSGTTVALLSGVVYGMKMMILSLLGTYLSGIVLDHFIFSSNIRRRVCIISRKQDEILDFVLHNLHSGATLYEAKGAYSLEHRDEIIVITDKSEYLKLMNFLEKTDPNAFVTVYNVNHVLYKPKMI